MSFVTLMTHFPEFISLERIDKMFGWFKKKTGKEKLQEKYEALMKEAMDLQRGGDIPAFAKKSAEAEAVLKQIEETE